MSDFEIFDEQPTFKAKTKSKKEQDHKDEDQDKAFRNVHLADNFLMDSAKKGTFYQFYQGRHLRYLGTHYTEEQQLSVILRKWLLDNRIPHNNTLVGNVVPTIEAKVFADPAKYPVLPFWRKNESGDPFHESDPMNIIAFRNGLLDVSKAVAGDVALIPHTANWVSKISLPHDFDPTATCPTWLAFLNQTFNGDPERIALLQEFFGYAMTPDNSYQKALVLTGATRGGKGTTARILHTFLGKENGTGFQLESLASQFGLSALTNKLIAIIGEVNLEKNQNKYKIFETFNSIVGNDEVSIEWKYNPIQVSVRLPVRFVICCNEMPNFVDKSGAFANRLLLIEYDNTVPENQRDTKLDDKLAAEVSGITNWALEGLARLRANQRFTTPARTAEKLNAVKRKGNPILGWLQDRVVIHPSLQNGNLPNVRQEDCPIHSTFLPKKTLIADFADWMAHHNTHYQLNYFYDDIKLTINKLEDKRVLQKDGSKPWGYYGLTLKPIED